jgi:hypothetical protein
MGMVVGSTVTISGCLDIGYNGTYTITSVDPTQQISTFLNTAPPVLPGLMTWP